MDFILDNLPLIIFGIISLLGWLFNKDEENPSEHLQNHDIEAEEKQLHIQPQNSTPPITEAETGRRNPSPTPTPNTNPIPNLTNVSKQHRQTESAGSIDFSWDESADSYENEIESQLKKIEATKREVSRLQSQSAPKLIKAKGKMDKPKPTRKQSSFRSVRSSLKDPKAARSAFIYGEVLGPPVSLRKENGVPGLTS